MLALALAGLAVALVWVAPRLLARRPGLRRSPRAALVAWQAVSLGGVLAAVAVAPAALPTLIGGDGAAEHRVLVVLALGVSAAVVARLLVSGHLIGTRIRAARAEHRALVDVLGAHDDHGVVVLEHPTPTAYCIPGDGSRVVLTRGVLDALPDDQLAAVLTHERAHLRARHDLLLEFFTVLDRSVPMALRSPAALAEVRLLVEALADRTAVRRSGAVPTARALVAIAEGGSTELGMSAGAQAPVRMRLLTEAPQPWRSALAYGLSVLAVVTPLTLLALAWA